jgi:hypothetical protein
MTKTTRGIGWAAGLYEGEGSIERERRGQQPRYADGSGYDEGLLR